MCFAACSSLSMSMFKIKTKLLIRKRSCSEKSLVGKLLNVSGCIYDFFLDLYIFSGFIYLFIRNSHSCAKQKQKNQVLVHISSKSDDDSHLLWFCISALNDWLLRKLAPFFHPIRIKTKTNRDSLAHVFARFASVTYVYIVF